MTTPDVLSPHRLARALFSTALLSASACTPQPTAPNVARSICGRNDVMDFAAAHFRATSLYVRPASLPAAEMPTLYPDTVLCTVRVDVGIYDAARAGGQPLVRREDRSFYVTKLRYGFRIRFGDG